MSRNDKNEITTLTLLDGVAGCAEIDLPIGRFVRVEGNDALFVVEAGDGCDGCALGLDALEKRPFPCDAFACCESDRRDETDVILRRVADVNEPEARRQLKKRRRQAPFVDLGDLRRALAVYAVDRPVAIRLPDGRKFAVADVRLDRDFEPPEAAPVLLIAGAEQEARNEL